MINKAANLLLATTWESLEHRMNFLSITPYKIAFRQINFKKYLLNNLHGTKSDLY